MIDPPKQGSAVLVTGGTGFLGQYVVGSLLETGYAVSYSSFLWDVKNGKDKEENMLSIPVEPVDPVDPEAVKLR